MSDGTIGGATNEAATNDGAWWVRLPRDAVAVTGAGALDYLHSQVSQDLRGLQVGQSTWTLVLQPAGRVDALARVTRTADDVFVLDTDAGFGDVLRARLARFKIRVAAELAPLGWTSIVVHGEAALPASSASDDDLGDAVEVVDVGGARARLGADPRPPAGAAEGTAEASLAARIEAGWPAMGAEIVPGETIPAELGQHVVAAAVSFTKGCYPGQELVERMDSRGSSAPRRLVVVDVAPGTVPGVALQRDGVDIGTVTSVAGTRALALVKRSALDQDAEPAAEHAP